MKLDEEKHRRLREHVQKSWKPPVACVVCRSNDWEIPGIIYELREFHGGNMVLGAGSSIVPVAPIICKVCGNTVLINPLVAGIDVKEDGNA